MEDIKSILRSEGFNFKKSLGQNFITDTKLLSEIVKRAEVGSGDTVVEIGCGAGTLTRAIAASAKKVVAFELDRALKPVLERTLQGVENAEVVFEDFLKCDLKKLEGKLGAYKVVANIPYYVTTPLITKIFDGAKDCESLTLMVQDEVAKRLCARENTPDYGAITAYIALRARAEYIIKVPKEKFIPSPKVDSAVVKMTFEDGRLGDVDCEMYKKAMRAAFSARRKTLENNLVSSFGLTRERAQAVLSDCGIDLKARGETLSPLTFAALAKRLGE